MTTLDKAKKVSITSYLSGIGLQPARSSGHTSTYSAAWRGDRNPSVSVDIDRNVFFDHGSGRGGTILDLVMTIEGCTVSEAINRLVAGSFEAFIPAPVQRDNQPRIRITNIRPLWHYGLENYVLSRGISLDTASRYCREVSYRNGGSDREYFALGLQNRSGGWVLRSANFKGCSSSDYTLIPGRDHSILNVVEGVFDGLTLAQEIRPAGDILILNSLVNLRTAQVLFGDYGAVNLLLDNDPEADRRTAALLQNYQNATDRRRELYPDAKDLNDHLLNLKNQSYAK